MAALTTEFRRVKSEWLPSAEYEILTDRYVFDSDAIWLQPEEPRKITSLTNDVLWFAWLTEDKLVYITREGVFSRGLDAPDAPIASFNIPENSKTVLSPDKQRLAINFGNVIVTVSLPDGALLRHAPNKFILGLTWSPDSRLIAYTTRTGLWILDPEAGASRNLYEGRSIKSWDHRVYVVTQTAEPLWSPDGRYISIRQNADGADGRLIKVIRTSDGSIKRRIEVWADIIPS